MSECGSSNFSPNWCPSPGINSVPVCLSSVCVLLSGLGLPDYSCLGGGGREQQVSLSPPPPPSAQHRVEDTGNELMRDQLSIWLPASPRQGVSPRVTLGLHCSPFTVTGMDGTHTQTNHGLPGKVPKTSSSCIAATAGWTWASPRELR